MATPRTKGPFAGKPEVDGFRHGRVPRSIREQQLLDVAEEAFTELGFDGTSIEEICRRAGVKRPIIYDYFGGKDGLYIACYKRSREHLEQRLATGMQARSPDDPDSYREGVAELIRIYFSFLAEAPSRWDLLYGPGAAVAGTVGEEIAASRSATVDLLAAAIATFAGAQLSDSTALAFAHATSGTCEQLARFWRRSPDADLDEIIDVCIRYTWSGLGPLAG